MPIENKHNKFLDDVKKLIDGTNYPADFSDLGNIIGIVLSKYHDTANLGFDLDDFYAGVIHGLSAHREVEPIPLTRIPDKISLTALGVDHAADEEA